MSEEIYMNGCGIMAMTRKLRVEVFDALVPAIIGASAAVVFPTVSAGLIVANAVPQVWIWLGSGALFLMALLGTLLAIPFFRAVHILQCHTTALEAETRRRGKGWAQS